MLNLQKGELDIILVVLYLNGLRKSKDRFVSYPYEKAGSLNLKQETPQSELLNT